MSEFAAANTASMVLFVGNPTNVVICEGFRVNNAAFTAYTILPFLACSVACFIALGAQFHKSKYLPRKLDVSDDLDVRSVLLDPVGAWVGSFLLGMCLVVIIVVSFFHVDVWKISLPFAVAKFIYDFAWDHYRFVNKISTGGVREKKSDEDLQTIEDDIVLQQLKRHRTNTVRLEGPTENAVVPPLQTAAEVDPAASALKSTMQTRNNTRSNTQNTALTTNTTTPLRHQPTKGDPFSFLTRPYIVLKTYKHRFAVHFPTFYTAFPRLPFALIPFAFSQFILIEGLAHQGWIEIFSRWLVIATERKMYPTIWLVGILGVILCNLSGTNIGATILLTKVVRAASASAPAGTDVTAFNKSAAIALAVASNIGAVSFTFSASLAGLLWKQILNQKGIFIKQRIFAWWNILPLVVMTAVGLAVVCAEMAILY